MKKHVKIYMDHFGYGIDDFIPCEVCGAKAVDIHHIEARGMGGSEEADHIDNLMAVCRGCHVMFGDKKQFMQTCKELHKRKMNGKNKAGQ
jgi:hypothetical protein